MAGIPGDASDERCGVRIGTVTRHFESGAGHTIHAGGHFLTDIRSLCSSLRVHDGNKFMKLCFLLKLKLAEAGSSDENLELLCEGVLSLLYFGLVYPVEGRHKVVHTVFRYFMDKCFPEFLGSTVTDYNQMVLDVCKSRQKSSLASVLLLYSHYEPFLSVSASLHILEWDSPETGAPQWLKGVLACPENTYKNLNKVLYISLHYMNNEDEINVETDYLNVLLTFFRACRTYRQSNYVGSMELLTSVNKENCGPYLNGWTALMCGLCLEQLGKFHSALMEYKEALQHSSDCYQALYYSARIFKGIGSTVAQFECLKLLSLVTVDKQFVDTTLQSTLLKCHLPSQVNLVQRALWLLASSHLLSKKWTDLPDIFRDLLTKWDDHFDVSATETEKCLLISSSDDIPHLPPKSCIQMGYMASLMFLKEYQEVEGVVEEDSEGDFGLEDFMAVPVRREVDEVCSLICRLLVAESFHHLGQSDKALSKCGRVLTKVESLYEGTASWKMLVFLTKAYLYKLLSILYREVGSNMCDNCVHFMRLQDQCRAVIEEIREAYPEGMGPDQLVCEVARTLLILRTDEL